MPYESTFVAHTPAPVQSGAVSADASLGPMYQLTLWPHQSLPRVGFVWFIGFTAALLFVPLFAVLGSPVLWGLLPFLLLAVASVWWALQRSYSDGNITETLSIWPDHIILIRQGPRRKKAEWSANPYWVKTTLHSKGGPVPNYLTLRGGDREVELGAFLSEPERIALQQDVDTALRKVRWVDPLTKMNDTTQCNTAPIIYPG